MVALSILVLFLIGLVAAALLGASSKILAVEEDPKVEAVVEVLPGANCGGCGFAGCEGYAQAVVHDPNVPAGLCVAGGKEVSVKVGNLTGKVVSAMEPMITFRRCEKIEGRVAIRCEYQGMPSCAAAALMCGGRGSEQCAYSCLGHGDCVKACPFDALYLRNGLVRVDPSRCTGCGVCTKACPRNILEVIPRRARVMICCSSCDKGKKVMEICEAGCIQCMKCKRKCPAGAISLVNGHMHIDQQLCLGYGEECNLACVAACDRKILRSLQPEANNADGDCFPRNKRTGEAVEEKAASSQSRVAQKPLSEKVAVVKSAPAAEKPAEAAPVKPEATPSAASAAEVKPDAAVNVQHNLDQAVVQPEASKPAESSATPQA